MNFISYVAHQIKTSFDLRSLEPMFQKSNNCNKKNLFFSNEIKFEITIKLIKLKLIYMSYYCDPETVNTSLVVTLLRGYGALSHYTLLKIELSVLWFAIEWSYMELFDETLKPLKKIKNKTFKMYNKCMKLGSKNGSSMTSFKEPAWHLFFATECFRLSN